MLQKRFPENNLYFDVYVNGERKRFSDPEQAKEFANQVGACVFRCEDELYYSPSENNVRCIRMRCLTRTNHGIYRDYTIEEAERAYNDALQDMSVTKIDIWIRRG